MHKLKCRSTFILCLTSKFFLQSNAQYSYHCRCRWYAIYSLWHQRQRMTNIIWWMLVLHSNWKKNYFFNRKRVYLVNQIWWMLVFLARDYFQSWSKNVTSASVILYSVQFLCLKYNPITLGLTLHFKTILKLDNF